MMNKYIQKSLLILGLTLGSSADETNKTIIEENEVNRYLKTVEDNLGGLKLNKEFKAFIKLLYNDDLKVYRFELSSTEDMLETDYYANFSFLSWLSDAKKDMFKKKIVIFIEENSDYPIMWFGFWKKDGLDKIDQFPIIAIDEGGDFSVVADNINEFLTLLSTSESLSLQDEKIVTFVSNKDEIAYDENMTETFKWLEELSVVPSYETFNFEKFVAIYHSNIKKYQKGFETEMLSFTSKRAIKHKQVQMDFSDRLANPQYFYYSYAGCSPLKVKSIRELEGGAIDHEYNEFIVLFDERSKNKTYQIEDVYIEIASCRVKLAQRFGIDYDVLSQPLTVDTKTLLERYREIAYLSLYWAKVEYSNPVEIFESLEAMDNAYKNEKKHFVADPYLALYWLVFYGLHFDSRYKEVKEIVLANHLTQKLIYLKEPIEFFDKIQDVASFKNTLKDKIDSKYFEKLSYDMWLRYLYGYRGGIEHYHQWIVTLQLHTKADEYLIRKVHWLKNNFEEYRVWDRLKDDYKKIEHIALTSYIQAINPLLDSKKKENYAKKFVEELLKYKDIYHSKISKKFAHTMLEDIKEQIEDKELYKKAIEYYPNDN